MDDQLEERVAALEHAVTDGEGDPAALAEAAVTVERVEDCEATLEDIADRVAELEAATQALRGYVGNVRSVNREVEERADLALSRVEALTGRAESGAGDWTDTLGGGGRGTDEGSNSQRPRDCEETHDTDTEFDRGRQPGRERCERCGQPTESGPDPPGSSPTGPGATGIGGSAGGSVNQTGRESSGTADTSSGGEWEPSGRDSSTAPAWNGGSAPESGPGGKRAHAGDDTDADGPIDRLRELL